MPCHTSPPDNVVGVHLDNTKLSHTAKLLTKYMQRINTSTSGQTISFQH